jgi:hypothetical protein
MRDACGSRRRTSGRTGSIGMMSIPRAASKSSTLRRESGYLTYIITTRRITYELLKYRNGLLMALTYHIIRDLS